LQVRFFLLDLDLDLDLAVAGLVTSLRCDTSKLASYVRSHEKRADLRKIVT